MSTEATQVITAAEVAQVATERKSLLATFSARYGLEPNKMMATLRATVLRPSNNGAEPSNEQVAAFLIVANHHGLNPFTKEIHGFVDKRGGIVPIVGVDGWAKKINQHPQFDGMDFTLTDESATCTMHRKDRSHPTVVTEYLSECKRPSEAWTTHPKRMTRHRSMVQCARLAFSFAGIYDPDEGEQVLAAVNAEIDVTPGNEEIPADGKIGAKKLRVVVEAMLKATAENDALALFKADGDLTNEQQLFVWSHLRSWERAAITKLLNTPAYKAAKRGIDLSAWSIEAMRACTEPTTLEAVWKTVQDAYAENDTETPLDLQTIYQDRKAELGAA